MDPGGTILSNVDVLIEGRDIARIGTIDAAAHPDAEIVDAARLVVTPGLVQTHVHLCQTPFRNTADDTELMDWLSGYIWPGEAGLDRAQLKLAARIGLAELLRGGTTTILDMATIRHTDAIFEAMQEAGMRGFSGKCLMDDREICPPELVEDTAAALDETERLLADWHGKADGRLGVAITPRFAVSCTDDLMRKSIELARKHDLLIHTHASENKGEIELVRGKTGYGNLEYFEKIDLLSPRSCLAHCVHLEEGDLERLRDSEAKVLHCPASNLKLASGIAQIPYMLEQGVHVSIGADGAPCNNRLDAFAEMRLAALIHKPRYGPRAMPAEQVFRMMTVEGARALGLEQSIARIAPGFRADLICVDLEGYHNLPGGDPYAALVYSARADDVRHVIVDGRLRVRDGRLNYGSPGEWKREFIDTFGE